MSKYFVYLDESGNFQQNGLHIIGGFIWQTEKDNGAALKKTLEEVGLALCKTIEGLKTGRSKLYTRCLHTTESGFGDTLSKVLPSIVSNLTKMETLAIYTYYDANEYSNEHYVDMLYAHMMEELMRETAAKIRREEKDASILFCIPSRELSTQGEEEKKQLEQRGFTSHDSSYKVTANDPAQYRKIAEELNIEFTVRTIKYFNESDFNRVKLIELVNEQDREKQGTIWGYYVADILMDWMRGKVDRNKAYEAQKKDVSIVGEEHTFLLLPYSENWKAARKAVNECLEYPIHFLEEYSQLSKPSGDKYPYKKVCLNLLNENNPFDAEGRLHTVVQQIRQQYIYQSRFAEAQKILERLLPLAAKLQNTDAYCDAVAELMSCNHHMGNNREATRLFQIAYEHCGKNITNQTLMVFNKYCEIYVDSLGFEEGMKVMQQVLERVNGIHQPEGISFGSIRKSATVDSEEILSLKGRVLSALGSYHAYLGETENAEKSFRDAIGIFESIWKTGNAGITRCYLIHALLDREFPIDDRLCTELEKYFMSGNAEKDISEDILLHGQTWDRWLKGIVSECTDGGKFQPEKARFKIWIFYKALYFTSIQMNAAEKEEIRKTLALYKEPLDDVLKTDQHPIEMLLKYQGLLANSLDASESPKNQIKKLSGLIMKYGEHGTIPLLCRIAMIQLNRLQKDTVSADNEVLLEDIRTDLKRLRDDLDSATEDRGECVIDRLNKDNLTYDEIACQLRYEFL